MRPYGFLVNSEKCSPAFASIFFVENVASMDVEVRDEVSDLLGCEHYRVTRTSKSQTRARGFVGLRLHFRIMTSYRFGLDKGIKKLWSMDSGHHRISGSRLNGTKATARLFIPPL